MNKSIRTENQTIGVYLRGSFGQKTFVQPHQCFQRINHANLTIRGGVTDAGRPQWPLCGSVRRLRENQRDKGFPFVIETAQGHACLVRQRLLNAKATRSSAMPGSFSCTRKLDVSRDQTQMIYNSFTSVAYQSPDES